MFWRAPVYWSADALRWPALAGPARIAILLARVGWFGVNLLFIVGSLVAIFSAVLARPIGAWTLRLRRWKISVRLLPWDGFVIGAIWIGSIFQTFLDHGDNPRFLVPLQSVVWLWIVVWASRWQVESSDRA